MGPTDTGSHRRAYLLLGPPGGGGDVLARALSLTGAKLARDLVAPSSEWSADGFGASRSLAELNVAILSDWGGDGRAPPCAGEIAPARLTEAVRVLRRIYPQTGAIVLQDPRLCFTGGVWAQALASEGVEIQVLLAHRDPAEVVAGLSRGFGVDPLAGFALWRVYAERALQVARLHSHAVVAHRDLLADPGDVMRRLGVGEPARGWKGFVGAAEPFLQVERAKAEEPPALPPLSQSDTDLICELERLAGEEPTFIQAAQPSAPPSVVWLLISGAPRSGTSLLRALVDDHPEVVILQEFGLTRLVRGLAALVGRPPMIHPPWGPFTGEVTALGKAATFYEAREAGGGAGSPGDLNALSFDRLAQGLFTALKPTQSRVIGDKTPMRGDWEDIDYLLGRLPGLRLLIVMRNPRDVINSSMIRRARQQLGGDLWPITTVQEAAEEWWIAWRRAGELAERLGPAAHFVKYERICEDPGGALDGVWDWLALAPHTPTTLVERLPPDIDALDAAEKATVEALMGELVTAWDAEPDPRRLLSRFRSLPRPYVPGRRLPAASQEADEVFVEGFSWREPWGRWTEGEQALIRLRHGLHDGTGLLELHVARAFAPDAGGCDVVVRTEGARPQLFTLGREASRMALLCPLRDGVLEAELLVLNPKALLEPPEDERRLGVGLESVSLRVLP